MRVRFEDVKRAVGGAAVYDDVLQMGVRLPADALDGFTDEAGGVVTGGDDADSGKVHEHLRSAVCTAITRQGFTDEDGRGVPGNSLQGGDPRLAPIFFQRPAERLQ